MGGDVNKLIKRIRHDGIHFFPFIVNIVIIFKFLLVTSKLGWRWRSARARCVISTIDIAFTFSWKHYNYLFRSIRLINSDVCGSSRICNWRNWHNCHSTTFACSSYSCRHSPTFVCSSYSCPFSFTSPAPSATTSTSFRHPPRPPSLP